MFEEKDNSNQQDQAESSEVNEPVELPKPNEGQSFTKGG